jgi:hypothetical protein
VLQLVASKMVQVNEGAGDVDTHMQIEAGDHLFIYGSGQIWAGVWFTGTNGPRGWNNIDNNPKFPLPGWHPYGLLGKLDGGYFAIGDVFRQDGMTDSGELFLRINDDTPGNGSGAFEALVQVYRDM